MRRRSRRPALGLAVMAGLAAALGWLGSGCASPGHVFEEPRVALTGVELDRLSLTTADLRLEFDVDNPNHLALVLDAIDYRLSVNGEPLLAGRQDERIEIAARSHGRAELPVTVGVRDLVRVVRSLRRQERSFYELEGGLRFALPVGGRRTVQIRRRGEVPLDWLARLGLPAIDPNGDSMP